MARAARLDSLHRCVRLRRMTAIDMGYFYTCERVPKLVAIKNCEIFSVPPPPPPPRFSQFLLRFSLGW
eukprot:SAG11_NODE_37714_length_255_cov_1.320513_1_plen_67_part_10